MNLETDPADAAFRAEVREFVARTLPAIFRERTPFAGPLWGFDADASRTWTRALDEQGWAVPDWPAEWGGTGWPPHRLSIFADELVAAECPPKDVIGMGFVGPVIFTFGTDEQKRRYLPRIRRGEEFWCQGFSEAGAGSDVLSLRTMAVRQGDHFVVNGTKLWITNAHNADMMFALVRIDAPGNRRQQGVSFLLMDMRAPGVTVGPVMLIDGVRRVNEVVLENVRVPVENLVGEQGRGWVYARFLLERERTIFAGLGLLRQQLAALRRALSTGRRHDTALIHEPSWRARLSLYEVELEALESLELRVLHARGDQSKTNALASMLKVRACELRQRVSESLWEAFGDESLEFAVDGVGSDNTHWSAVSYLFQRSATIAGGTSEIQRNIIAGVSLGL